MTINTQKLRQLISNSRELPWVLATSNSWRRIVDAQHNAVCTPITQRDGHPDLLFFGGPDGPEAQLLIEAVNALPELLDRADRAEALDIIVLSVAAALARHGVKDADDPGEAIDVLVADKDREIARLKTTQTWQPIETAPKDGRTLLLGRCNSLGNWRTMRGQWMSKDYIAESWEDPDGVEPGWFETAVEAEDPPNCWSIEPTHWMPLPAAPGTLQEKSNG